MIGGSIYISPALGSSKSLTWLMSVLFVLLVTRGLFQLIMPTNIALAVHGALLICLVGCLIFYTPYNKDIFNRLDLAIAIWLTAIIALISALTTVYLCGKNWPYYLGFTFYFLFAYFVLVNLGMKSNYLVPFHKICISIGWLLTIAAVFERLNWVTLPGSGPFFWIRPASLTGSMLHFPLIISLIGFVTLEWYLSSRQTWYLLSGLFFCAAPIIALSRSGALIVFFGLFIFLFLEFTKRTNRSVTLASLIILSSILAVIVSVNFEESPVTKLVYRTTSIMDLYDAANAGRVVQWALGFSLWLDTNLFVGEKLGDVTNASRHFGTGSSVVESSLLQQLLNLGLLGTICFYYLLIRIEFLIESQHRLLRAVSISIILQTLIYQSIEILGFITLFLFIPWISKQFKLQQKNFLSEMTVSSPIPQ